MFHLALGLTLPLQGGVPEPPDGDFAREAFRPGSEVREISLHTLYGGGIGAYEFLWRGQGELRFQLFQTAGFLHDLAPDPRAKSPEEPNEFSLGSEEALVVGGLNEGQWSVRWTLNDRAHEKSFEVRRYERGSLELRSRPMRLIQGPDPEHVVPLSVSLCPSDGRTSIEAKLTILDAEGEEMLKSSVLRDCRSNQERGQAWRPGRLQTNNSGCIIHYESDAEVGLEIGKLPPGSYRLIAARLGHEDETLEFEIDANADKLHVEIPLAVRDGAPFYGGRADPGLGWSEVWSTHSYSVSMRPLPSKDVDGEDRSRRFQPLPRSGSFDVLEDAARWLEPGWFELRLASSESVDVYVGPLQVDEKHGATWVSWFFDRPGEAVGVSAIDPAGQMIWKGWTALSIDRGAGFEPLPGKVKVKPKNEPRIWIHGVPPGRIGIFGDPERTAFLGAFDHDGGNVKVNLVLESFSGGTPQVMKRRSLQEFGDSR